MKVKKILTILFLVLSINFNFLSSVSAQGFFGFQEKAGCEEEDKFLPVLVICGRSPQTGACSEYTKPCTVGDFIETGRRAIIWIIVIVLLIIPLIITYQGVLLMFNQEMGKSEHLAKIKKNILWILIYFVCLLGAWLIVKLVVDVFQVNDRINTFLIDENGNQVKARPIDLNR